MLLAVPWSRLAGAAALVGVSWVLYWATTDRTFAVDVNEIPISGTRYTSEDAVRAAMQLPTDRLVNIFRIPTGDIEARIEKALPAVRVATVMASLPDTVTVSVEERRPMLVWRSGDESWLVDGEGMLFAPTDTVDAAELGSGATGTELPSVDDRRFEATVGLGTVVPPLDLEVVRLLLTITPEMLRSDAPELYLRMDDTDGYILDAGSWRAIFGPYTAVLRPPSIIPRQVQCLDALLAGREDSLATVVLALSEETCGTFQERAGPRATPKGGRDGSGSGDRNRGGKPTPRP